MADNLPPSLTLSQLQGASKDLASQGAPREVVQGFVDNYHPDGSGNFVLKTQPAPTETTPTQGNQDAGVNGDLFSKAAEQNNQNAPGFMKPINSIAGKGLDAVASSEQNFGKDIAQGFYLAFGGQNKISKITQSYLDNASVLTEHAKSQTDPVQKALYLKEAAGMIADAQRVGGNIIGNARTPEQIVGDAIGTGADIAAVGDYSGIVKSAGIVEKPATSILSAVGKGAVRGAIQGGAYGLAKGGAGGLSANKNAQGVATDAVVGGLEGAAGGAILGGAIEGGGAALKGKPLTNPLTSEQELSKIQETIAPKPTVKEAKLAVKEGRFIPGKESTLLKGETIDTVLPSQKTINAAQTIQRNIPNAAQLNEADLYTALDSKTGEIAQNLKPKMQSVPVTPKSSNEISSAWNDLKKLQIEDVPATEEANVIKLQNKFQSILDKLGTKENATMNDVWEATQKYDQSIKEGVKKATTLSPESLQMQKEIWLQNRSVLSGMTHNVSTGLDETSQKAFSDMTDMYHSKEGILSKAKIETKVQPSKLVQLIKKHPIIDTLIGTTLVGETARRLITGKF